ncbi:MAG TPA: hypothetical protein VJ866_11555 [Pyrinomonadaceae bacterium]|nr:hypothetical protein [Pyrinomonadaceae bacterium]
MEQKHVRSIEGSPRPADIFEPHMPGVELLSDMDELFRTARAQLEGGEVPFEGGVKGQRAVAVVTPGRLIMFQPCPPPGSVRGEPVENSKKLMPPDPPLKITAVSYTFLEAFMQDEAKTKCIPFLGFLLSFAYIGHNVVVFEGHPTAFESGVRDADVLFIDSGMLPFIQEDWFEAARRVMRPGAKFFIHKRENFGLMPVGPSGRPPGWQYSEFDGEKSYANCLLTTLARGASLEARVTSGLPLPDLATLTTNPDDLNWIAGLPFRYDQLDADEVIETISGIAKWSGFFKKKGELNAKLALPDGKGLMPVRFTLRLTKDDGGRKQLIIER